MKTMVVLGDDKISGSARDLPELDNSNIILVIDKSTNIYRVLRLVLRGRLNLVLLFKMILCEVGRPNIKSKSIKPPTSEIRNNKDLLSVINVHNPSQIILFRAGLIVNKEVIMRGIPLMNIHCAKVPSYGGIGSIQRALTDCAIYQSATLHQVTTTIDSGVVFDEEPYILDASKSYCENENLAYSAGIALLRRCLAKTGLGMKYD